LGGVAVDVAVAVAVLVDVDVSVGDGDPVFVAVGVCSEIGSASVQSLNAVTPFIVAVLAVVLTLPPGCVSEPSYLKMTKFASFAVRGISVGSR